jgi:hypothetical protein
VKILVMVQEGQKEVKKKRMCSRRPKGQTSVVKTVTSRDRKNFDEQKCRVQKGRERRVQRVEGQREKKVWIK